MAWNLAGHLRDWYQEAVWGLQDQGHWIATALFGIAAVVTWLGGGGAAPAAALFTSGLALGSARLTAKVAQGSLYYRSRFTRLKAYLPWPWKKRVPSFKALQDACSGERDDALLSRKIVLQPGKEYTIPILCKAERPQSIVMIQANWTDPIRVQDPQDGTDRSPVSKAYPINRRHYEASPKLIRWDRDWYGEAEEGGVSARVRRGYHNHVQLEYQPPRRIHDNWLVTALVLRTVDEGSFTLDVSISTAEAHRPFNGELTVRVQSDEEPEEDGWEARGKPGVIIDPELAPWLTR